jgi:hypothetical protein
MEEQNNCIDSRLHFQLQESPNNTRGSGVCASWYATIPAVNLKLLAEDKLKTVVGQILNLQNELKSYKTELLFLSFIEQIKNLLEATSP